MFQDRPEYRDNRSVYLRKEEEIPRRSSGCLRISQDFKKKQTNKSKDTHYVSLAYISG
jgi:hypothetical protein